MPVEQLTYPQIAERLGVSVEAVRALVRRHRLPRSRSNDGKTLITIDLEEITHKPMPARAPRGDRAVTDVVAALTARVQALEADSIGDHAAPGVLTGTFVITFSASP